MGRFTEGISKKQSSRKGTHQDLDLVDDRDSFFGGDDLVNKYRHVLLYDPVNVDRLEVLHLACLVQLGTDVHRNLVLDHAVHRHLDNLFFLYNLLDDLVWEERTQQAGLGTSMDAPSCAIAQRRKNKHENRLLGVTKVARNDDDVT
jgi:hypothetical protein